MEADVLVRPMSDFIDIAQLSIRIDVRTVSYDAHELLQKYNEIQTELNKAFVLSIQMSALASIRITTELGIRVVITPSSVELGSWKIKEWISIDGKQLRTAILAALIGSYLHGGGDINQPQNPSIPTETTIERLQELVCGKVVETYRKIIEEENKITIEEMTVERKECREVQQEFIEKFERSND